MNKDTATPSRITDEFFTSFGSTTDNHRLRWRPWLDDTLGGDTTTPFPLRVTDIDLFQHVNNTVYWQEIHEVLSQATDLAKPPYRAVVEYRRPIKPHEPVMLHSERYDDGVRIWFAVDGGVRACAMVCTLDT